MKGAREQGREGTWDGRMHRNDWRPYLAALQLQSVRGIFETE